jgi:hypothetical protein
MRAVNIHLGLNSVIHEQRRQQLKAIICKGRIHTVSSGGLKASACCVKSEETRRRFKRFPDGSWKHRDEDHMVS